MREQVSVSGTGQQALLALDLGTTNTKALVVRIPDLHVLASHSQSVDIFFPHPGWVEQDPIQMWQATSDVIGACVEDAEVLGVSITGVTISNQRESVVGWDRTTGEPIGPVLGWQDTRTEDMCRAWRESGAGDLVHQSTGLKLDPMFSAPKMVWLLQDAKARGIDSANVCLGTVDSWIGYQLTGEFFTEAGNASRTLLYDIHQLSRTKELLDIFGLDEDNLAPVLRSDADFASTQDGGILPAGIPIVAVLADSHSALYFQSEGKAGHGKATYGTGSSVMVPVQSDRVGDSGIATTIAWLRDQPVYGREGNILATGAAIKWVSDLFFGGNPALLDQAAMQATDNKGLQFVPAFAGLGAPYFDRQAVGLIEGITAGCTAEHFALAALESVAQQVADVVEAICADGAVELEVLHADGGATASALLMQLQADLLARPVQVSSQPAASALGAALMGVRKLGYSTQIGTTESREVEPRRDEQWRQQMRNSWKNAVARSRIPIHSQG